MACHLHNEKDALKIIQLLCEHKHYKDGPRIIDLNSTDRAHNNVLHHAVFGNKINVVKYLITLKDLDKTQQNNDGLLAIDFCQNSDIEKVLSKF